jgi:hypothetical protein
MALNVNNGHRSADVDVFTCHSMDCSAPEPVRRRVGWGTHRINRSQ